MSVLVVHVTPMPYVRTLMEDLRVCVTMVIQETDLLVQVIIYFYILIKSTVKYVTLLKSTFARYYRQKQNIDTLCLYLTLRIFCHYK